MRNLKRVLSLALACVMVIGMMVMTTGAADFDDAAEIKNTEAVEVMSTLGIINGMGDGSFNPTGTLTRGQAAKIIAYMLLGEDTAEKLVGSGAFTDTVGHWADPYVSYCSNLKIVAGYGDGKFGPDDALTDLAFGKMVMVALGEDAAQFEGASWATVTGAAMIEMGLVKTATGANISRDAACALALEGLKYTATPDTYVVTDSGVVIGEFDSKSEAAMYAKLMGLDPADDVTAAPAEDCLLTEVHNTTWVQNVDAYGRTANVYSNANWDKDLTIVTAKPVATFDGKVMKTTDISAKLGSYKLNGNKVSATYEVNADTNANVIVWEDGESDTVTLASVGDKLADGFKDLTGDATTVEVYANAKTKAITKVVIVNTYADIVDDVEKADEDTGDKAYVTLKNSGLTFETEDFAEKDVVLYTVADGEIVSMEAAESFTGTLDSYTNKGTYTIDGEDYQLSTNVVAGITGASVTAYYGKDAVYYLGQNGKIVYVTDVKGAAVVTDGYALITDSAIGTTTDNFSVTTTTSAQVKAVLSDGTQGTYDLALTVKGATKYVTIEGTEKEATPANLSALENAIYTYTLDGSEITLVKKVAPLTGSETKNGSASGTTDDAMTKASTTVEVGGNTVIVNSDTIFVLKAAAGTSLVVKTGLSALENTTVPSGSNIVVDVTYNAKTSSTTNVAAVVFAEGTAFSASTTAASTDAYVYVDGAYVVTKDAKGSAVYTADATKADGTVISVTKANVAEGIYFYSTNNEIMGEKLGTTKAAVGTIAGTTYELGGSFLTVNDRTDIVIIAKGAKLEKGAEVCYYDINGDKVVDLIYVTKAAD